MKRIALIMAIATVGPAFVVFGSIAGIINSKNAEAVAGFIILCYLGLVILAVLALLQIWLSKLVQKRLTR